MLLTFCGYLQRFVHRLKGFCLGLIEGLNVAEEDLHFTDAERASLVLDYNLLHEHATLQLNFTTYDVKRERDVVKPHSPTNNKCHIMLPSREDNSDGSCPSFWYARVLGIFHVDVSHAPSKLSGHRINFLWVRWFGQDAQWRGGDSSSRMDRIGFVPDGGVDEPFGFVDPDTVIRGCHLIPAFALGRTFRLLSSSRFREFGGDYVNFYVNKCVLPEVHSRSSLIFTIPGVRFVTRDMLMRYNGLGVGHVDGSTRAPPCVFAEQDPEDGDVDVLDDGGEVADEPPEVDIPVADPEGSNDDEYADDMYGDDGFYADGGDGGDDPYIDDVDVGDIDDDELAEL